VKQLCLWSLSLWYNHSHLIAQLERLDPPYKVFMPDEEIEVPDKVRANVPTVRARELPRDINMGVFHSWTTWSSFSSRVKRGLQRDCVPL
jgi:hypothetical protein